MECYSRNKWILSRKNTVCKIEDNVIIGARIVVNSICESNFVYTGNPVRKISIILKK